MIQRLQEEVLSKKEIIGKLNASAAATAYKRLLLKITNAYHRTKKTG
jgi:hypothetical protein